MDIFLAGFILGVGTVLVILVIARSRAAYKRAENFLAKARTTRLKAELRKHWQGEANPARAAAVLPTQKAEEPSLPGQVVPTSSPTAERPYLGTMDHRRVKPIRRR